MSTTADTGMLQAIYFNDSSVIVGITRNNQFFSMRQLFTEF
jgi:hypothetical protein